VKQPTFPLREAAAWFLSDKAADVEVTTLATYRTWLTALLAHLGPTATLADLTLDNADRFTRATANLNTRMNQTIALRSFATYLAESKLWYEGEANLRLSVLRDLHCPQPSEDGQPAYSAHEIRAIMRACDFGVWPRRNRAVIATLIHGLRGKEARCLLLANLTLPVFTEVGHLRIERAGTKRRSRGVREVPIEPAMVTYLREYVRLERPEYAGTPAEPVFLTDEGEPFSRDGWNSMAQRIRRAVARETGIAFRQHRLRSTSVRLKQEADWPDSAIIQVHGWNPVSGQRMLRRYGGAISTTKLKTYPQTLERVFGR
jgi:integrase